MNLTEALADFDAALYSEVKDVTRAWYASQLLSLVDVLGDMEITAVSPAHLRQWRRVAFEAITQYGAPPSAATKHGMITAVKRFFRWLLDEELIKKNPAARLDNIPVPTDEPKAADPGDFLRLVGYFSHKRGGLRDLAILLFLFDTGCRVSTICTITADEIDWTNGRVYVHEKGRGTGKGRWIFFLPMTVTALQIYQERYRPNVPRPELFINQRRGPLTRNGVWAMLKNAGIEAGCQGPVNPHAWRHAFAIERLKAGQNLVSVSKMLGHANILITAKFYGRYALDQLQEEHGRYSPLPGLTFNLSLNQLSSEKSYVKPESADD